MEGGGLGGEFGGGGWFGDVQARSGHVAEKCLEGFDQSEDQQV